MKNCLIALSLIYTLISCRKGLTHPSKTITSVSIEEMYTDSTLSIRAIDVSKDKSLAFAANNGVFGLYNPKTETWKTAKQEFNTLNLQFRAVARTSQDFFMLSVESPALLFKTGDTGLMEVAYIEDNKKAFYDAMLFWNNKEGIAIGDPTEDCLSIIVTRDGGKTWNKLPCKDLPKAKDGEAAFAASNSNIAVFGNYTWIATGGKASRILFSPDKGKTWNVFETPITQGEATTGMYSIAFYDALNGFAIGGDYTKPENNQANKIVTKDGGKTWKVVGAGKNPGYRSCVQYVPESDGKALVTVGFKGIDCSNDEGNTWKHISDEGFYTIRFLNDSIAYAAGKGRIAKLTFQ